MLPLDALLAFVYFDLNFCGYLHRRDIEKLLLTLGLHLCKEQVSTSPFVPGCSDGLNDLGDADHPLVGWH